MPMEQQSASKEHLSGRPPASFQMLIALVSGIWSLLIAFAVILCRASARADAMAIGAPGEIRARATAMDGVLLVFEDQPAPAERDPRWRGRAPESGPRFRVRGVRGRGGRFVAGS